MVPGEEKNVAKLSKLYESYGYMRFKMSRFEEYDTYVKNKAFLTSDNVITFTDTNGKLMALKPDVTLSIVKNSKDDIGFAQKVYYNENVYRVSGDSHAFKEIMQSGLECIGAVGKYEIAEVITVALESLSLLAEEYVLDLSHLGIIASIVDGCKLSADAKTELLTCFGSKNVCGAEEILERENVSKEYADRIVRLMGCNGGKNEVLPLLKEISDEKTLPYVEELEKVLSVLPDKNIRIDFSVINDMRYYNGIVFQGFVKDVPKCVLFGGQYDLLLKKMRRNSKAIGFAVYLDELKEQTARGADVDDLIVYGENADLIEISNLAKGLREQGRKVLVQKSLPAGVSYGNIIEL